MSNIQRHICKNGLQIVTENMPNTKTVAVNWGIRAGVAFNKFDGESVLLGELIQRGANGVGAKEHHNALDAVGIKRRITCGVNFLRINAVLLGNRLFDAIPLLGAYFLNPSLCKEHLPACKSVCLQSILSIADNPSLLGEIALNTHHQPSPFNRSGYGVKENIAAATIEQLRNVYKRLFVPNNSIMVIAGNVNHSKTVDLIETFVSGWKPNACDKPKPVPAERGNHWVKQKSSQVHLSFAFDAPNAKEDSSILESVAMTVFGGSSSGRLFTQVRQRRSLCYSVSAHYAASKEHSVVRMHAGTTPQRAQETADICLEQLHRLKSGITKEEFDRTIHTMKARTVMRGESTAARAGALWGDLYALEKTRSLDDRLKEINNVTFEEVNEWLARRTFGKLTFVAVGPEHITADRI